MSDTLELKASVRDRVGKGSARKLRREGLVPAVIYGDKKAPLPIAIPYKESFLRLHAGGFMTSVFTLDVDGEKHRVIPKDYQLSAVRDFLEHVDFLRVSKNTTVTVDIPVIFLNEEICPGLKTGGALNIVRYTVEVICRADAIPESFEVDLATMEMGDSVHISAVDLPDGVEPTIRDRDFTIATIASPAGYSDVAEDEEGEEGEEGATEEETSESPEE